MDLASWRFGWSEGIRVISIEIRGAHFFLHLMFDNIYFTGTTAVERIIISSVRRFRQRKSVFQTQTLTNA